MQGYNLAEGRYENRTLSEDEMWSTFSNLFSAHSKNSSSYKFGFLKSIMDNLYNVDANLTLSFDRLFGTFAEVYWNLVLKHGIRQQPVIERSQGTYLEQVLNATAARYAIMPNVPFESISDEAKLALALHDGYKAQDNATGDMNGLDLNRQTIMGENEALFKALIELNEGRYIEEEDYFPMVVKQYIDHGAMLLEQEYKYGHDFYSHLVNLDKSI